MIGMRSITQYNILNPCLTQFKSARQHVLKKLMLFLNLYPKDTNCTFCSMLIYISVMFLQYVSVINCYGYNFKFYIYFISRLISIIVERCHVFTITSLLRHYLCNIIIYSHIKYTIQRNSFAMSNITCTVCNNNSHNDACFIGYASILSFNYSFALKNISKPT